MSMRGKAASPWGLPVSHEVASSTSGDTTIYVRKTGNDRNSGLSASSALLTLTEAANRIPRNVNHEIVIDIGEGTWEEMIVIENRFFGIHGSIRIRGTLGQPTLTTGTATGTIDTLTDNNRDITDSSQTWTENELVGMFLKVDNNDTLIRVIRANSSTTITVVDGFNNPSPWSISTSMPYEILTCKTIFDDVAPL